MSDTIRIPVGPSGAPVAWATIDAEDYERIIAYRWYLSGTRYAFRTRDGKSVFLHREVLGFPNSEDVNHINGDKLDNRKANLEACTHAHNVRVGASATVLPMREEIRALRLDGWTNRAIAKRFDISPLTVSKYASDLPKVAHPSKLWSRERLIELTREFHAEHGRLPASGDFTKANGLPCFVTVYRFFDGMPALREAAGFGRVDLRKAAA